MYQVDKETFWKSNISHLPKERCGRNLTHFVENGVIKGMLITDWDNITDYYYLLKI